MILEAVNAKAYASDQREINENTNGVHFHPASAAKENGAWTDQDEVSEVWNT